MNRAQQAIVTSSVTMLLCLAATQVDSAFEFCVYDRGRILSGEIWRLLTGNLVHFSWSHLVLNVAGFTFLIGVLEKLGGSVKPRVLILGGTCIGVVLLLVEERISRYGGLSGVVMVLAVMLSLRMATRGYGGIGIFLLVLLGLKIARDFVSGEVQFVHFDETIRTAAMAHLGGAVMGVLIEFGRRKDFGARHVCGQDGWRLGSRDLSRERVTGKFLA